MFYRAIEAHRRVPFPTLLLPDHMLTGTDELARLAQ